ncbi:hypothetical protein SKAU_G00042120 [Synaphobranchus kaupii]|uniref:Protein kinase domain-containing protein n=1 Tax=Synaphobranchus kaupii TaxID=118154 RepID=A0A9Q1G2A7_SYNKA|nr:hypothetical protein SKAU_G00042120 [Synaphobranchus kaupii]
MISMASHTDSSMFLFNVPPSRMEMVCKIIDSGDGSLGWRDLAARILPSWSELRLTERLEAAGKSPTSELLWSWAQKNKTVGDLLRVLEDMGHERALHVFRPGDMKPMPKEWLPCSEDSSQESCDSEQFHYSLCTTSQAQRSGKAAFSELYKGTKGSLTFAVKLFKQEKNASWKKVWNAFRTEMEVLHHKQHPNILELWGCFLEGERYCLVTPYLPNGSLSHQLHDQDRLNIIKGTARAVAYLHTAPPCGVICGNITSENILLDESALDVFSLGVVMMETLTGQKPVLQNPKRPLLRDMLFREVEESGGVDVCLSHLDVSAGCWPHATALCLFHLAMDCTASRHKTRPSMHRVLEELSQLLPLPGPAHRPSPSNPAGLPGPCECSQSEVTFLSDVSRGAEHSWPSDLYSSWPVQCSCAAEDGQECEDCISNGFTPAQSHIPTEAAHGSLKQCDIVQNLAKERFIDKIQLYNKGLINTEELLSMKID